MPILNFLTGALNALLLLSEEQRRRGVIAASAGNHAQGLSYHGTRLGVPVTIVTVPSCSKCSPPISLAGGAVASR